MDSVFIPFHWRTMDDSRIFLYISPCMSFRSLLGGDVRGAQTGTRAHHSRCVLGMTHPNSLCYLMLSCSRPLMLLCLCLCLYYVFVLSQVNILFVFVFVLSQVNLLFVFVLCVCALFGCRAGVQGSRDMMEGFVEVEVYNKMQVGRRIESIFHPGRLFYDPKQE